MSAIVIDGKQLARAVRGEVKQKVKNIVAAGVHPTLAIMTVGEDKASAVYVRNKAKACEECGIRVEHLTFPDNVMYSQLAAAIHELNHRNDVDGIILQLPLPERLAWATPLLLNLITPYKDVDGLHCTNVGKLTQDAYHLAPCTPHGVIEMLHKYGIPCAGKHAVIVGRSNIVGKPLVHMLLQEDCTVTICHSKTEDLAAITKQADILVSAVGRAGFITSEMVKPGAAVIDVGINRTDDGHLCGDVDFEAVKDIAGWITPVPGGVGPMTVAMLMWNVVAVTEVRVFG